MSNNYFEITYRGPWTGQDNSLPENMIDLSATPFSLNCHLKNAELRTRPQVASFIPAPPDGSNITHIDVLLDANEVTHTVGFSSSGLWQLNPKWRNSDSTSAWNRIGGFQRADTSTISTPLIPWVSAVYLRKLYFTSDCNTIFEWDGITNIKVTTSLLGGRFLIELANHLIVGYTTEPVAGVDVVFPERIRWSASGVPNQFDPAVNLTAGSNDMLDVPDSITGLLPVGKVGFIFRTNGITEMIATGIASNPWDFNHLWSAQKGVGNILPWSLASFGTVGVFASIDDIYSVTANSFDNIGGKAMDAINNDIFTANNTIQASITPKYSDNYIYLQYHLVIPVQNGTIIWQYDFKNKGWSKQIFTGFTALAAPIYIPVS